MKRQLIYGLLLLFVLGILKKADAQMALNVAVAANFAPVMKQIGAQFTGLTGIPVQLTISSSGRLFAQIKNKAPFDLFFSADAQRPEMLHYGGECEEPMRYATGKAVLWSKNEKLCSLKVWKEVVTNGAAKRIAMANPHTAPYGTVVRDTCNKLEYWPEIEKKLVYGNNVGQAFQYAEAGVVDAAFIAKSIAMTEKGKYGCSWEIREALPVEQKACVPTFSSRKNEAYRLLEYIASDKTAEIRERFGYK